MVMTPEVKRRLRLRHLTNETLFPLYDNEIVLRLHNVKNLSDTRKQLAKFKEYLNGFPPSPELAKGFLAQYSNRKPRTLYRYSMMIKMFMRWYGEPIDDFKVKIPKTLPQYTEDNLTVFTDKELDWFINLTSGAMKSAKDIDEAIDLVCSELHRNNNPNLVKAIRGAVYGVAGEIEDEVEEEIRWRAGLATIPGILAILRLIDRALEAKYLEAGLSQKNR